ncbi:AMP-binding protein [Streptomyces parvus]|uniref:AMP-binding protein n=1 Tax=Streptomyces parvus TaxID=66428 RepID=UPI0035DC47B9
MSERQAGVPLEWDVVVNGEGQFSIWSAGRQLPPGWRAEGTGGSRERCLARVQEVWTDPRPIGLRRRTAEGVSAGGACVSDIVGAQARRAPGEVAVQGEGFALSFAGLDGASNRWARYLTSLGVGRGSLVGVLLGRGAALHVVTLGAWKAGAGCLPLDPEFPAARLHASLVDAGARILVTEVAHGPIGFEGAVRYADDPEVRAALARCSGEPFGMAPDAEDVAYMTPVPCPTGRPLAVAVTHRNLMHHVGCAVDELTRPGGGGTAVFASVALESAAMGLWAPLCAGQRVLLASQGLDRADLGRWLAASGPFDFLILTARQLRLLASQLGEERSASLASRYVIVGSGRTDTRTPLAERIGPGRLCAVQGTAEVSYGPFPPTVRPGPGARAGERLLVLDASCLPVPDGGVGELYVAGPGVARGYAGRAALTAQRFVPDPDGPPGTRMHRTGRLARRAADGEVRPLGRSDRQLWLDGHRADPAEVEETLHDHPCVGEAFVVPVRAAPDQDDLAAYVVPRPGAQGLDAAALAAHCVRRLPRHLVPGSLVVLDELPRDADGRVDRSALPAAPGERPAGARRRTPGLGLAGLLAEHRVPGVSVAVLEGGRPVLVEAAGSDGEGRRITPRTGFPAGVLGLQVAALGALRLVDEGVLAPDTVVGRAGGASVALADLLGRRRVEEGAPPLAAVLEDATGEAVGPLMRRLVLGPLGLDDSWFGAPPLRTDGRTGARWARTGHDAAGRALDGERRALDPAACWATAADLAAVALEVRRCALGAPLALVGRAAVARLTAPGTHPPHGLAALLRACRSGAEFTQTTTSAGYHATWAFHPHGGRGLVVLANGRSGRRVGEAVEARLRNLRHPGEVPWTAGDGR